MSDDTSTLSAYAVVLRWVDGPVAQAEFPMEAFTKAISHDVQGQQVLLQHIITLKCVWHSSWPSIRDQRRRLYSEELKPRLERDLRRVKKLIRFSKAEVGVFARTLSIRSSIAATTNITSDLLGQALSMIQLLITEIDSFPQDDLDKKDFLTDEILHRDDTPPCRPVRIYAREHIGRPNVTLRIPELEAKQILMKKPSTSPILVCSSPRSSKCKECHQPTGQQYMHARSLAQVIAYNQKGWMYASLILVQDSSGRSALAAKPKRKKRYIPASMVATVIWLCGCMVDISFRLPCTMNHSEGTNSASTPHSHVSTQSLNRKRAQSDVLPNRGDPLLAARHARGWQVRGIREVDQYGSEIRERREAGRRYQHIEAMSQCRSKMWYWFRSQSVQHSRSARAVSPRERCQSPSRKFRRAEPSTTAKEKDCSMPPTSRFFRWRIIACPLWTAYALFDSCFLLLIAVLVTAIWLANGYNWYGLGYMLVVFLFYGCAATAYSYVISLFAPSQLAAIAMTCIVQVVIAMLFFVGCFLTVDMADLEVLYTQLDTIYWTVALICPAVSLLRALLVTLNVYGISCDGAYLASNPVYIGLFGGPILYLSGRSLEAFGIRVGSKKQRDSSDAEKEASTSSDATEDAHRLSSKNNRGLRVGHISKTFGTNKAVDDVSFGILPSKMAAKQHLGVCPQFDAVDSMTLSEHLHFYARARGLNKKERGTKRKLSLGIALISNPSVLLLDEPSSGMDAASKRALWKTLEAVSAGRSLLLTTHSMEEADSLCDRAGIMASRMLALGTISSLHERVGDKVYVHLVHEDSPRSSPQQMAELWLWVEDTFAIAETGKAVGGQVRFAVPVSQEGNGGGLLDGSSLGRMFRAVEAEKERMGIRDYTIGHATLDQVFLNVVGRHGVDEENSQVIQNKSIVQELLRR
ncbi:ABC transporter, ABC-A family [Pseudocercospora fijiensis CIRAD86]|uniref:ABC transporter, ABC-A family n=1 Tax=Pseudocercospora fijiensis (strain CIRAD86) TaxID=383855 RepID=M3A266_PSEFD|nr:ABC transporter, ABC-A family [Pseudocercospora fijiensis CIRAD86]EME85254.1 ABC transporter, ABC-A family [Pseudocercospora fijiensis CIRAD86]